MVPDKVSILLAFLNASKYCGSVLKNEFVVFLLLTNFYQIFKESCHFENPVETCQKWKFVVFKILEKYINLNVIYFSDFVKID